MHKLCTLAILFIFLFSAAVVFAQATSPDFCSNPAEAAKMVNPVKPTAESLAQGKKYYGYDCAMCHGATGNGKAKSITETNLLHSSDASAMRESPTVRCSVR